MGDTVSNLVLLLVLLILVPACSVVIIDLLYLAGFSFPERIRMIYRLTREKLHEAGWG